MQGGARVQRVGEVLTALAVPAGAAAFLHRLGESPRFRVDWTDLDLWLQVTPLGDVGAALLRLAGLAAAYWILASAILYLVARASGIPAAIRAVEWATLPVVRRVADRAVAIVLAGSSVAVGTGPAVANELPVWPPPVHHTDTSPLTGDIDIDVPSVPGLPPPAPASPRAGAGIPPLPGPHPALPDEPGIDVTGRDDDAPDAGEEAAPGPASDEATGGEAPAEPAPAQAAQDAAAQDAAATDGTPEGASVADASGRQPYEVVAGDNLWVVAEAALAADWGRAPSVTEVARYWRAVTDHNRSRLRSGDPDLIHPGELLELPTVPTPEEAHDG
ncbi:MAG: hypothetical protein WD250_15260 [Egibacteraceae bacterium]